MRNRGYTLAELIIATAVFGVLIIISNTIVVSSINNSRKSAVIRESQSEAREIIEFISRDIEALKPGDIIAVQSSPYFALTLNKTGPSGSSVRYELNTYQKYILRSISGSQPYRINSENISVTYLKFTTDAYKNSVIIEMKIRSKKAAGNNPYEFWIKTAVAKGVTQ